MTVSAVIPVHNRAHCVGRAVESILAQTEAVEEIIVVDDGSSDDLQSALKPFPHAVRLIRHPTNQGAAAARNTGMAAARGEYLAFLDSDDVWKPGKLRQQMAFMARMSLDVSCTNFELVGPRRTAPEVPFRPYGDRIGRDEFLWGCYTCPGSTLVIKRSILLEHGGYDPAFPRYEDWDLLLRLTMNGTYEVGFLKMPLASVRLGSPVNPAAAAAGLDRMLACHLEPLRTMDAGLGRRLLSAVAFGRASLHARQRRYIKTGWNLLWSLFLWPRGNQAVRMILLPGFRQFLRSLASHSAWKASRSV